MRPHSGAGHAHPVHIVNFRSSALVSDFPVFSPAIFGRAADTQSD